MIVNLTTYHVLSDVCFLFLCGVCLPQPGSHPAAIHTLSFLFFPSTEHATWTMTLKEVVIVLLLLLLIK